MKITSEIERHVVTINEHSTALEAAILMTSKYIGALVVKGEQGIAGLFTERDLMMQVVGAQRNPSDVVIKDVMSEKTVKVGSGETCDRCLDLMKENRCRHLLVFDGDEFIGIVSLRDIVALMIEEREEMISRLKEYISG
ncbi:MAG: CBS domain-containing protein [Zetaproteobacteria bacterium]|nr:MAG: CBS domain-containing protein [Zetaproteobacteria bacterium]